MIDRVSLYLPGGAGIWFFCLLTLVLYLAGLPGDFFFDDAPALTGNNYVKVSPEHFDDWRVAAHSSTAGPLGRPVAMLTFAANYALAGKFSPEQVKFTNLLIHIACGAALYAWLFVMLRCTERFLPRGVNPRDVALITAAIWLLHPLQVSTVLYSVQRMAQLSTLFVFLGLAAYCRFRARWASAGASAEEIASAFLWCGFLLLLAVFSKENGILLLWLLAVVEATVFRGAWDQRRSQLLHGLALLGMILPVLVVLATFLISSDLFLSGYSKRDFTLTERLLTQPRVLWQYVAWLFWPAPHHMGFQHDYFAVSRGWFDPITTIFSLLGWCLVCVLSWVLRHRLPVLGFCLLFFLVGHSMEASVIALEMVYEHRNYLPGAAACLLLALCLLMAFNSAAYRIQSIAPLVLVALLGIPLFFRADAWSSDFSLARANVQRHQDSARSRYFYANALLRQYRLADSLGLSKNQASNFLILGREEFLNMLEVDRDSLPALVMLHYLDSRFYPAFAREKRWDKKLLQSLDGRVLEPEDRNALHVLFTCYGDGECLSLPGVSADALLDRFRGKYSDPASVLTYRIAYLRASEAPANEQLPVLEDLLSMAPHYQQYYPVLISQYAAIDDISGIYQTLLRWMKVDISRRDIAQQRLVFAE